MRLRLRHGLTWLVLAGCSGCSSLPTIVPDLARHGTPAVQIRARKAR